jgi:hypothetical protein
LVSNFQSGNPAGRLRGSRNKLSEEVICALLRNFRQKAITQVRHTQPAAYLKICVLLVPKEMKLEHTNPLSRLSDEAIEEMLGRRSGESAPRRKSSRACRRPSRHRETGARHVTPYNLSGTAALFAYAAALAPSAPPKGRALRAWPAVGQRGRGRAPFRHRNKTRYVAPRFEDILK